MHKQKSKNNTAKRVISWRVSLSEKWSAKRRCFSCPGLVYQLGVIEGYPSARTVQVGVEWWDKILGEWQGAAVSSAPGVELISAAPDTSFYAPGAPVPCLMDAPGHASTHASSWALPANPVNSHQGEHQCASTGVTADRTR